MDSCQRRASPCPQKRSRCPAIRLMSQVASPLSSSRPIRRKPGFRRLLRNLEGHLVHTSGRDFRLPGIVRTRRSSLLFLRTRAGTREGRHSPRLLLATCSKANIAREDEKIVVAIPAHACGNARGSTLPPPPPGHVFLLPRWTKFETRKRLSSPENEKRTTKKQTRTHHMPTPKTAPPKSASAPSPDLIIRSRRARRTPVVVGSPTLHPVNDRDRHVRVVKVHGGGRPVGIRRAGETSLRPNSPPAAEIPISTPPSRGAALRSNRGRGRPKKEKVRAGWDKKCETRGREGGSSPERPW
jgi:hypothetical protein